MNKSMHTPKWDYVGISPCSSCQLCSRAVVRSCKCVVVRLPYHTTAHVCKHAVMQSCRLATAQTRNTIINLIVVQLQKCATANVQ